jgi:Leucine-rich repeat (LRR) protein
MGIDEYLLTEEDIEYYKNTWGFNPKAERIKIRDSNDLVIGFRYEEGFPLDNDPLLDENEVSIWARLDVIDDKITNYILFKHGDLESAINCVHTAINKISLEEFNKLKVSKEEYVELSEDESSKLEELVISTENRPVELSPEEHFVSLKSFTAGISDVGIGTLLAYNNKSTTPLGFNSALIHQMYEALHRIYILDGIPMFEVFTGLITTSERHAITSSLTNLTCINKGIHFTQREKELEINMYVNNDINMTIENMHITKLSLQNCGIEELPEEIKELSELNYLDLWNNELTVLPEFLANLEKLEDICISWNSITAIPEKIKKSSIKIFGYDDTNQ